MIRPIGNRLLLKSTEVKNQVGGILIPDTSKEKPLIFDVLAVGEGSSNLLSGEIIPITSVKAGDKVLVSKHAGHEVKEIDEIYRIVNLDEVLGVIE